MFEDLFLTYKDFDLKTAITELQQWKDGLGNTYKDEVTHDVLEGVIDLIFDNCTFE